jgi:hypothetical protein
MEINMKYPKWLKRELIITFVVISIILAVMIPGVILELIQSPVPAPALLALVIGLLLGGIFVAWVFYSTRDLPESK